MSKPAGLSDLAPTLGATVLVSRQSAPAPPHDARGLCPPPQQLARVIALAHSVNSPAANTRVLNEYSQITNNPIANYLLLVTSQANEPKFAPTTFNVTHYGTQ